MTENNGTLHAIIVMGVSGSGKSSIGEKIAAGLGLPFVEGDALHPAANVEKMSKGIPLSNEDRMPWLDRIGEEINTAQKAAQGVLHRLPDHPHLRRIGHGHRIG